MKKILALLLVVVMLVSVMSACDGTKQNGPKVNEALFTKPTEEVSLTVWYAVSGVTGETFVAQVEEYMAANPNVKIEISYAGSYADAAEKISANLLTGTAPDIALMAAGPLYTGAREDWTIEGLIEDPAFDKNGIYEGIWKYAEFSGRICAIPYGISIPVLYYNKDITDAAGIDMEKEAPKTWDELYALAEKCVNGGHATYGFDVNDAPWLFKSMLNQNGNTIIDTTGETIKPAYNDEKAVAVGEFWQKLATSGLMPIDQHSNSDKAFLANQTAFAVSSSIRLARWAGNGVNFGVLPMPSFDQQSVALGGNVIVCFPKEGEDAKLAAAWDLLKFLCSEEKHTEFAMLTGYLPMYKSAMESDAVKAFIAEDERRAVVYGELAHSWSYWHFDEMGTMDNILWDVISKIENGANVKEALDKAAQELLDEM